MNKITNNRRRSSTNRTSPRQIKLRKSNYKWIKKKRSVQPVPPISLSHTTHQQSVTPIESEAAHAPAAPQVTGLIAPGITPLYDIIRFPVIDWQFRWQRPQQLSEQFAQQGHRVFYVTTEINSVRKEEASKEEVGRFVSIKNIDRNVWLVTLCAHKPLNLYKDEMSSWDIQYLKWSIEHVRDKFGISQVVSIVDLPFWTPLVTAMEQHHIVYDCMDHHAGFSTNDPAMLHQEERLLRVAGLVVTSSQHLYDWAIEHNPSTVLIRNAADISHFLKPPEQSLTELKSIKQPIIGYYGAISDWFDIRLIETVARNRPEWTFVLIGHTFGCDTTDVEKLDNVVLLGEKPYHELPIYLHRFQVALIPFMKNMLTKATNPVKLYEYLAAGKPVVSTELPEVEAVASDMVSIADTPDKFEQAIHEALQESGTEQIKRRQEFARHNNWVQRYQVLNDYITQHLFPKVSVIIVVHNKWSYTEQCLRSLLQKGHYPNLEVVIVDNASTDQTSFHLKALNNPLVKVISSQKNLGFSAGNTLGCLESTGEYMILLNNDTLVPDGSWITRLLRPFHEDPQIGMTGPMSNYVGNDQALDHFIGDAVYGADVRWLHDFYELYHEKIRYTDLLGFFCVAMKRSVWDKVGSLDPAYGIGMFEDDDYCERVRNAGYRLAIVEDAFVYHYGSATIKELKPQAYDSLWEKNKAYYEQKWNKTWRLPKGPHSLFHLADHPQEIANRIHVTGKKFALVLGDKVWDAHSKRWQKIVMGLTEDENLYVIVYAHEYHGNPIIGTRKVGPRLYFTNRIDLFSQVTFDHVIYCGSTDVYPYLRSDHFVADSLCYHDHRLKALQSNLPNIKVFGDALVTHTVRNVMSLTRDISTV
ncbi:glycosyltransferase [Paenibacillus sp. Y412MC10]|uniref:glycosyltransferase n=1 Tax=Geobacillus sp. (strain Y412MC10) TaxID=481743 RepID=UPI0011A806E0|nr:glycosyltransferase [Paenibacillus sp. Y412MC10]